MEALSGVVKVAKPKGRPKRSERDDTTVKLSRALVLKAKIVATQRGISVAELLSELLQGPLDRAYDQALKDLGGKR
jgi:hypothetical protein